MAQLDAYRSRRDFRKTKEPSGAGKRAGRSSGGGIFVVQEHAARRLHYDFRLEHDGVLWSWAVTRGPSLDPSEKRLAVHVEDHPVAYADFEGTIPKGEYGGGSVIVWDEGEWLPQDDPDKGMEKGHLDFELRGNKLNGKWHLVRLKPRRGEKRDNWLLIKGNDPFARSGADILEEAPQSVKSGLTVDEIGADPEAPVWRSRSNDPARRKKAGRQPKPGKAGKLPDFIAPCLATLRSTPPAGQEWVHEVKFDGYRIQARLSDGKAALLTRKGLDWTQKFGAPIIAALAGLDCSDAILDGEAVALDEGGVSSFSGLQAALSEGRADRLIYYVFDLLFLDGADLTGEPLVERKAKLTGLLKSIDAAGPVRLSEHFAAPGQTMLRHVCRMGLEGVVSKRADAPYHSGRGHDWIKSKCTLRQEFVIAGYLPSSKPGRPLRSLALGYFDGGELKSVGHVGTGFSERTAADLKKKLDGMKRKASPFAGAAAKEKGVVWVAPRLVAEVEFRSWTADHNLRQASFQGLREDKPAEEIVAEIPDDAPAKGEKAENGKAKRRRGRRGSGAAARLTNPDKALWPEAGVTKQDLLDHYQTVWPLMREFTVDRPLALVRAPDGVGGQRFFQKHASPGMPEKIERMKDPVTGDELLFISDFDGLAALVQLGVVEIHIWGAKIGALETPDQIIFDLDPDEGLDVDDVRSAARDVRGRLDELGLPAFLKTSGGKGYHIAVPLDPSAGWERVKGFAHDFARAMEQAEPERYTSVLSKKARHGRIFIDYLRNGRGATTVAAYSARGRPAATMSMPISWDMLDKVDPAAFHVGDGGGAVARKGCWRDFFAWGYKLR